MLAQSASRFVRRIMCIKVMTAAVQAVVIEVCNAVATANFFALVRASLT